MESVRSSSNRIDLHLPILSTFLLVIVHHGISLNAHDKVVFFVHQKATVPSNSDDVVPPSLLQRAQNTDHGKTNLKFQNITANIQTKFYKNDHLKATNKEFQSFLTQNSNRL